METIYLTKGHVVLITLLLAGAFAALFVAGVNYGEYKALERCNPETISLEVKDSIASRYFKFIGNPSTLQEHCTFVRVVYNDQDECKGALKDAQ